MISTDKQSPKSNVIRPFVVFRMPGSSGSSVYSGRIKPITLQEAFNLQGFLFAPFLATIQNPVVLLEPDSVSEIHSEIPDSLIDQLQLSESLSETKTIISTDRGIYIQNLIKLIEILTSAEAKKVVISRTTVIDPFSKLQLIKLYNVLCKTYPEAFVYFAHFPPYGIWMGATPETLISCHGNECTTMALAATRKKGSQSEWGQKEREEQAIVSRYIHDILIKHQVQSLHISDPFTKQAGVAEHLCTTFNFELYDQSSMLDLVADLHPTPATCGIPKNEALRLIRQFEKHNREYYSGYLGPINHLEKTDLFVNLRCMKILGSRMTLFAGGGITQDSVPENEWEETKLKTKTLLSVIEKIRG
jgi:isochorismate synthase